MKVFLSFCGLQRFKLDDFRSIGKLIQRVTFMFFIRVSSASIIDKILVEIGVKKDQS